MNQMFLGIILAASLLLTGCSKDVVIHTSSGAVNVGEVTAETARTKVTGTVGEQQFDLGVHPTAEFASALKTAWVGVEDTAILERDMTLDLQLMITYLGTKNRVDRFIGTTTITCPKGFMVMTCMSRIESTQDSLMRVYKEKFSYLK